MFSIKQKFNKGDWVQLDASAAEGLVQDELARVIRVIDAGSCTLRVKTLDGRCFPVFGLFEVTGIVSGSVSDALTRGVAAA